jgi:hypothetical protein
MPKTTFAWHNDPDSTVDTSGVVPNEGVPDADSVTYTGFDAVNTSNHSLSDVGLFIPFALARAVDPHDPQGFHYEAMTWNGMGFLDPNYNNTGEAVLLTPTISTFPDGTVRAGSVADKTDTHVFAQNSASTGTGSPFPLETFNSNDLLPFADLGSFAAGRHKAFNITWTAHWYGEDLGDVRVGGYLATLAPDHPGQTATTNATESYTLVRFG